MESNFIKTRWTNDGIAWDGVSKWGFSLLNQPHFDKESHNLLRMMCGVFHLPLKVCLTIFLFEVFLVKMFFLKCF